MWTLDLGRTDMLGAVAVALFILLLKVLLDPRRSLRQSLFLPLERSRWHRVYWRLSPLLLVGMAGLGALSYMPLAGAAAGWLRLTSLAILIPLLALAAAAESETDA